MDSARAMASDAMDAAASSSNAVTDNGEIARARVETRSSRARTASPASNNSRVAKIASRNARDASRRSVRGRARSNVVVQLVASWRRRFFHHS